MKADRRHFVSALPGTCALLATGAAPAGLVGCAAAPFEPTRLGKTLFARLITIHVRPGKLEEAAALFTDSVIPAVKPQKGFRRALLLTDAATASAVSITLWDSEADLLASESNGYFRQQIGKVSALLARPPQRQGFAVRVDA